MKICTFSRTKGGYISSRKQSIINIIKSPEKTDYIRAMFSMIAPRYDLMNRIISMGRDLAWRRLAVRKANFKRYSRILDLGIGTGDMAREVIRQVEDSEVYGLDNCFELIEYGKSKKVIKQVRWILADGRQLPFSDNSFDGIVAAFSIRNMTDLSLVFTETYRVVIPGGKIVILEMVKPRGYLFNKIFNFHFKHIIPKLGRWLGSGPDAYSYLLPSIENFYSSENLRIVLQNLGWSKILSQDLMFKTVTICIGTK